MNSIKTFNIIVAKTNSNVIGDSKTNGLPWKIKKDMDFFKTMTTGNTIIMGYNTFKSIGSKILPNRLNIVINRDYEVFTEISSNLYMCSSFDVTMTELDKMETNNIFLIGGGNIYREYIKHQRLDKLYITNIKREIEGDIYFPVLNYKYKLIDSYLDEDLEFLTYKYDPETVSEEYNYINYLKKIEKEGIECDDRTGVGTLSLFGTQFKWDLKNFPLLTTRKMYFKGIVEELLWFLRGETDNKILNSKGVHIWNGNSSREFLDKQGLTHLPEGDIGKSYGFQYIHWGGEYIDCKTDYTNIGYNQFAEVIRLIKEEPNSRRIMINLWNPSDLKEMALPPCMYSLQFRVYNNILHLHVINRSNDFILGHPWNIGTSALMVYIIANITNLTPGTLTHSISDAHIYKNHIEGLNKIYEREPFSFPLLKIKNKSDDIKTYKYSDFELIGYNSHPNNIKFNMAI